MLSTVGTRTRHELRYYKLWGDRLRRLRIRVIPKSLKKWKTIVDFRINGTRQTGAVNEV